MARIVQLKPAGKTIEFAAKNNQKLVKKLIPFGYPKREKFKGYDDELNFPISLPGHQIEKFINQ